MKKDYLNAENAVTGGTFWIQTVGEVTITDCFYSLEIKINMHRLVRTTVNKSISETETHE